MRNLKRALSLALASIMLLGMMVTGAGAASTSFTDFDQIVNQEAAEVTSGLGIFDGYTDGSFGPENVVTRAEMAVIICKLLNGSDVDPGNFTGISQFNDVPSWAEGYVNYCASMGIVVGVGEGKFNPSATVSTVEAATMLLKALGYFVEEDKLGADWKTVVTGRATSMHLYGDLTLSVDEGLTRDNVAELVFHTLFAQRVAYDDNRHLYVKNTNRDVVVTNGTDDPENTLARNTFGMWYVDGIVTANSNTDETLSETVNNGNRTDVLFYAEQDLTYMGGATVTHYPFEYTTGLDMIGHAARVYYSMERNAPVVYAIADRATKAEYITYSANTTNLANAANEAGFRKNTILQVGQDNWKINYSWGDTYGTVSNDSITTNDVNLSGPEVAKTLIVISNSSDYAVDCVIVLDQYLDTVKNVYTRNDAPDYDMTTSNATRLEVPHATFEKGDYVIVTDIGKRGEVLNFEAPELVSANISTITGVSDNRATVKSIVADGTTYNGSPVFDHKVNALELDNTTNFEDIATVGQTTLILDFQGKCIGLGEPEGLPGYAYAAQFGRKHVDSRLGTDEVLSVLLYFADGTSGVYAVNTTFGTASSNTFYGYDNDDGDLDTDIPLLNTWTDGTYQPQYGYATAPSVSGGSMTVTDTGLGIYDTIVRADGTVVLKALSTDYAARANVAEGRLVAGHSTLVAQKTTNGMTSGNNITVDNTTTGDRAIYQTSKSVYFYVTGKYDANANRDTLNVGVKIGVANAKGFTSNGNDNDNNSEIERYAQVFANRLTSTSRFEVSAMMVYGLELEDNSNLYFYKEGNYHINTKDGTEVTSRAGEAEVTITFDLYNSDGELVKQTYDNNGKYYDMDTAKTEVANTKTGFYTIGRTELKPKMIVGGYDEGDKLNKEYGKFVNGSYVFVLDSKVAHIEYQNNIFTEDDKVAGISAETLVVDATGKDMFHSVGDIYNHWMAGDTVTISYYYQTTGSNSYKVKVVFVTGYSPKGTEVDRPTTDGEVNGMRMVFNDETDLLEVYIDPALASRPTYNDIATAAKAAYEKAGFTVTNVVANANGLGYWTMVISRDGLTSYVTNKNVPASDLDRTVNTIDPNDTLPFGMATYIGNVVNVAKVNYNGKLVGYLYQGTYEHSGSAGATVQKIVDGSVVASYSVANGKFEYSIQNAEAVACKTVDLSEVVGVTVTGTNVKASYDVSDILTNVIENGTDNVPNGTVLTIGLGSGATATKYYEITVSVDGKSVKKEYITGTETFAYTVNGTKAVSITAAEVRKVVVASGASIAYKLLGTEANATTLTNGTVYLPSTVNNVVLGGAASDKFILATDGKVSSMKAAVGAVKAGEADITSDVTSGEVLYIYPAQAVTYDATISSSETIIKDAETKTVVDTTDYVARGVTLVVESDSMNSGTKLQYRLGGAGDYKDFETMINMGTTQKAAKGEFTIGNQDVAFQAVVGASSSSANMTVPNGMKVTWEADPTQGIEAGEIDASAGEATDEVPVGAVVKIDSASSEVYYKVTAGGSKKFFLDADGYTMTGTAASLAEETYLKLDGLSAANAALLDGVEDDGTDYFVDSTAKVTAASSNKATNFFDGNNTYTTYASDKPWGDLDTDGVVDVSAYEFDYVKITDISVDGSLSSANWSAPSVPTNGTEYVKMEAGQTLTLTFTKSDGSFSTGVSAVTVTTNAGVTFGLASTGSSASGTSAVVALEINASKATGDFEIVVTEITAT